MTHPYIESSPACWAVYGEVLAREYTNREYMAVHRLTVDAYAAQHPGRPSTRSIQSVGVHLCALHLVLERGLALSSATAAIRFLVGARTFTWLEPPARLGELTVADVLEATTADEHGVRVRSWARSVYDAWAVHHARLAEWTEIGAS